MYWKHGDECMGSMGINVSTTKGINCLRLLWPVDMTRSDQSPMSLTQAGEQYSRQSLRAVRCNTDGSSFTLSIMSCGRMWREIKGKGASLGKGICGANHVWLDHMSGGITCFQLRT